MCRRNKMEMNNPSNAGPCCDQRRNGRGRNCGSGFGMRNFDKRCFGEAPFNVSAETPCRPGMGFGARREYCRINEAEYSQHMIEIIQNKIQKLQEVLNNLKEKAKSKNEDISNF